MMLASHFALSAFNAPSMGVAPALGAQRAEALTMFGGGKKAAPKKAGAKKPAGRKLVKSAANSKAAVSATGRSSTFIDVTGRPYVEVDTFVPKYDEIGVLPPLGRWDPLQIREQGPERYRRFVEMEIKHGRMSMAAVTGVLVTYSGMRWPGYLSTSEGIKFSDIPVRIQLMPKKTPSAFRTPQPSTHTSPSTHTLSGIPPSSLRVRVGLGPGVGVRVRVRASSSPTSRCEPFHPLSPPPPIAACSVGVGVRARVGDKVALAVGGLGLGVG